MSRPIIIAKGVPAKVSVRPVEVGDDLLYQWTERVGTQERHKNLTRSEFEKELSAHFPDAFADAHLFTNELDLGARVKPGGTVRLKRKGPSRAPQPANHNRDKKYALPVGKPIPFLVATGIMTPLGQVRAEMSHKYRQINRFVELVDDVLDDLPHEEPLRVVDFGCGKSYLTFALHHHFTQSRGRVVEMVGLERRSELVEECRTLAGRLRCEGLEFHEGEIGTWKPKKKIHLAISLHACDTATDDAIAAAVRWGVPAIFAVPCCQHELASHLDRNVLAGILEYGILRDRFAAIASDAMRAQWLETQGYRTQILEFIDLEHTAKNLLIRAVRRGEAHPADAQARAEMFLRLKAQLRLETSAVEQAAASLEQGTGPFGGRASQDFNSNSDPDDESEDESSDLSDEPLHDESRNG